MKFIMSENKLISCGCLILYKDTLLICKPFRSKYWNLPKGKMDNNETPLQTALRETREETGLTVDPKDVVLDLGLQRYLDDKDLHMYVVRLQYLPSDLKCQSFFTYKDSQVPEMVGYKWIKLLEYARYLNPALISYMNLILPKLDKI
jgi:8-oxo-dGTP pyrophosphatase MutT (NUDIX family)